MPVELESPPIVGMPAALASFAYLGLCTGIPIASIASILEFHSFLGGVSVPILFGIGQLLDDCS